MLPLPGMNQFHQGCKHVIRGHNCLDKQDDIQTPPSLQHHWSTRMLLVTHTLFMSITPTSVLPNTVVSQGHYNNVRGVTAGQAPHNSSDVGARWDTMLASTASTSPCVARVKY